MYSCSESSPYTPPAPVPNPTHTSSIRRLTSGTLRLLRELRRLRARGDGLPANFRGLVLCCIEAKFCK